MHDTWTLRRDEEAMAMLLARGQKNIFIPILPKDPTSVDSYKDNVSVAANDRCFGIDPNEDPDHYDDVDAERNALEMIPCLRKGDDGKLWFSSCVSESIAADDAIKNSLDWCLVGNESVHADDFMNEFDWFNEHFPLVELKYAVEAYKHLLERPA